MYEFSASIYFIFGDDNKKSLIFRLQHNQLMLLEQPSINIMWIRKCQWVAWICQCMQLERGMGITIQPFLYTCRRRNQRKPVDYFQRVQISFWRTPLETSWNRNKRTGVEELCETISNLDLHLWLLWGGQWIYRSGRLETRKLLFGVVRWIVLTLR